MSPAGISVGGGHVLGPERAWLHDAVNLCASSWLQGSQPEEGDLPAHRFAGRHPEFPLLVSTRRFSRPRWVLVQGLTSLGWACVSL